MHDKMSLACHHLDIDIIIPINAYRSECRSDINKGHISIHNNSCDVSVHNGWLLSTKYYYANVVDENISSTTLMIMAVINPRHNIFLLYFGYWGS